MDSRTTTGTIIAGIILGIGLDFCVREYLLPWLQERQGAPQSTTRYEQRHENLFSKAVSPPTSPCQQILQQSRLRKGDRPRITEDAVANGLVLASNTSRKVLKIGTDIVVKYGEEVNLAEAEAMMFLRLNTTVPVPEILDTYTQDGENFIVMEYIQGALLKKVWGTMSADDKSTITKELADYVRQIRRLPAPEAVLIGSISGGPAVDRRQLGSATGGPFRSENDFNQWQLAQLHPEVARSSREMYAALHKADHRIVFTHGDLAFHNIIVKDGHITAIIDWEYSGWYPEHWDYCKTLSFLEGSEEGYLVCKEMYEKQYHPESFLDMWFGREILHGGF